MPISKDAKKAYNHAYYLRNKEKIIANVYAWRKNKRFGAKNEMKSALKSMKAALNNFGPEMQSPVKPDVIAELRKKTQAILEGDFYEQPTAQESQFKDDIVLEPVDE